MSVFTAISVDDERAAHQALKQLLLAFPDIELKTSLTSPLEAFEVLTRQSFDLLFLDIAMPDLDGLHFLRRLSSPPVTVLMTAHAEHALDAFSLGVRDYLLKPVSQERIARCLAQVRPLLEVARHAQQTVPKKLAVKHGNQTQLFDPTQVWHIEASGNFAILHLTEGQIFASESLKDLETRLFPFGFIRIHKSHMIHRHFLKTIKSQSVYLSNGKQVPVGRAYRPRLLEIMASSP